MITLHTFPGRWGLESLSPFCMKVEVYLKLAKLEYKAVNGDPRKAPKGKMPYIVLADGTTVADSSTIIEQLERKHGQPIDGGLDERDRARGHVIRRTLEEGLYFIVLYTRWAEPAGWSVVKDFFKEIPPPARWLVASLVRKKVLSSAVAQGTGRHSRDEIYDLGRQDLFALSTLLGDGPYLLGDRIRTVDIAAYAFLANVLRAEIETPLKEAARKLPSLDAYVSRVAEKVADAAKVAAEDATSKN